MPIFASGGNTDLSYIEEVTYGDTPVTPTMQLLPYSSVTLGEARTEIDDSTRRSDRMRRQKYQGNAQVTGDVVAPLMYNNFDPLLESTFRSTFVANVLKPSNDVKSMTFERIWDDVTQYQDFRGVEVNTLALSGALDAEVQATFTMVGKTSDSPSATPLDPTPTAISEQKAFINVGGTISEGGAAANISAFDISFDNGLTSNYVWGNRYQENTSSSLFIVTGTFDAYFENAVLMDKFRDETLSTLTILLSDGTNTMTIVLPNIKYTVATNDDSTDTTLTLTMQFEGLYDATSDSNASITVS